MTREPIILHMPRRSPALYWWALRMRYRNRRKPHDRLKTTPRSGP